VKNDFLSLPSTGSTEQSRTPGQVMVTGRGHVDEDRPIRSRNPCPEPSSTNRCRAERTRLPRCRGISLAAAAVAGLRREGERSKHGRTAARSRDAPTPHPNRCPRRNRRETTTPAASAARPVAFRISTSNSLFVVYRDRHGRVRTAPPFYGLDLHVN